MRTTARLPAMVAALFASAALSRAAEPDIRLFFAAASRDEAESRHALAQLSAGWRDAYTALILDLARLMPPPPRRMAGFAESDPRLPDDPEARGAPPLFGGGLPTGAAVPPDPLTQVRERLVRFLEKRTGRSFGHDLKRWRQWMWKLPYEPHADYALFKSVLYAQIDPRTGEFFGPGARSLIRLDEVDWGGVKVNGIPPLDHPKHVGAREASYLKDKNVVFGIFVNGEARAYPKRILGWHEMARDRVGGVELTVVYCTLCGTVIPYGSEVGGTQRTFGTSGLLYRSNKLMFDEESKSLWSTVEGRPVIGPLAGSGLELKAYPVVTTTWEEWAAEHPDSTVVSLDTGHERDYAEGAAYRDYFATDRLMFAVPTTDPRLENKAEVLTLRLRAPGQADGAPRALAISAEFLRRNPVYHVAFAARELVIVTSPDGANRVYEAARTRFRRRLPDGHLADDRGGRWRVTEEALVPEGHEQVPKPRLPAWRTFWFGWYAQFPDTTLIK